MRDLAKRLNDMADNIKYGEEEHVVAQHGVMRALFREASERVSLLEALLTPMSFSYERDGDSARVKLEAEVDMADVREFLEVLAESA